MRGCICGTAWLLLWIKHSSGDMCVLRSNVPTADYGRLTRNE